MQRGADQQQINLQGNHIVKETSCERIGNQLDSQLSFQGLYKLLK